MPIMSSENGPGFMNPIVLLENKTDAIDNLLIGQLARFILVGLLNTIVGYGVYFISLLYVNYLAALIISHIVGVSFSYIWNRRWTFKSKGNKGVELLRFESVYLAGLAINMAMLYALVGRMGFDPRIVQLVLLPLVTVLTFLGHRYWSFKSK